MDSAESLEARPLVTAEPLVMGAMLIGIGSMLLVTGLAINTAALTAAALRWISEADVATAPAGFAKQQWSRATAVSTAWGQLVRDRAAASPEAAVSQDAAPSQEEASPAKDGPPRAPRRATNRRPRPGPARPPT